MTVKERLRDWTKRLTAARSALGELHELDAELRAEHGRLLKERSRIASSPPPLEEILANMEAAVSATAARWAQEHSWSLLKGFGPGLRLKADGSLVPERPGFPSYFVTNPFTFKDMVGIMPDAVKVRLRQILSSVEYVPGSPMADRERLLAEVDERIRQLEGEHTGLVAEAAGLTPEPVLLALLPSVAAHRAAEQAKADRERAQREARERAAAAVNAQVPAPRAVASPYLAGGGRLKIPGA
jgi:hypothetical protein